METVFSKAFDYFRSVLYWPALEDYRPFRLRGFLRLARRNGEVRIGRRTTVWPDVKFSVIAPSPDRRARLTIGSHSSIGDRTQIHCCENVTIGNRVLISWDVNILENNYHATSDGLIRSAPIVIEDRVWIGCRAIILSGVRVGEGSVVGAGAVVTRDVAPGMLVAGNPAREIRKTGHWV